MSKTVLFIDNATKLIVAETNPPGNLTSLGELSGQGFATHSADHEWACRVLVPPASGMTIDNADGIGGDPTFTFTGELSSVVGATGNGFLVRGATGVYEGRTLRGTTFQVDIQYPDGLSGDPVFSLPQNLHTGAAPQFAGLNITGLSGMLKAVGGSLTGASSGVDYAPATVGATILKGLSGGFTGAVAGIDYAPATSTGVTGVPLMADGSGGFTGAVAGIHYLPAANPRPSGTVSLPAGLTSSAPVKLQTGSLLTTPEAHAMEWDGDRVYFSDHSAARHKVAYLDDPDLWYLSAGVVSIPTYTDEGSGNFSVGNDGVYNLIPNADGSGTPQQFQINGFTSTAMTDGATNYIVANYNGGSPVIQILTSMATINETTIIPIVSVYRSGTNLHIFNYDKLGIGLVNKLHRSIIKTQRYRWQSGLKITEAGTRNVVIDTGTMWFGAAEKVMDGFTSASNDMFFCYHVASAWTVSMVSQYNNTQYDDGTALQSLTGGKYAVNFIYRGIEDRQTDVFVVLGQGNYTLDEAKASQPPATLPSIIATHAVLIGRIIAKKGVDFATQIDSAFNVSFTPSASTSSAAPIFCATADKTVADTVSETSLFGTGTGSLTLPANFFYEGKRISVELKGTITNTATPTLQIKAKLGSTVVVDTGAVTMVNLAAARQWTASFDLVCRSAGATGVVKAHGEFIYPNVNTPVMLYDANTGTSTINTTTTQALDVTATWGTQSPSNSIICDIALVEGQN